MNNLFYQELKKIIPQDRLKLNERLSNHTTLHIGGEADYFVMPSSVEEIGEIINLSKSYEIPFYIIGNGSNLLVSDQGYRGLIIKLSDNFSSVMIKEDGTVSAQAGVLLAKLASDIAKNSLTGFEFAAGIPGTLGGAVAMNAGAYDGEMKQCIMKATVMDMEGNISVLSKEELELGYRTSILQKKSLILLEADLKLNQGDSAQILDKIRELNARRREKQPLSEYSAGSTFKRPTGYYAGKLIEDAGLRGYQAGGAAVSTKHCGFVINKENATAADFLKVIHDVIKTVYEKSGVTLEPEVKFLGEIELEK